MPKQDTIYTCSKCGAQFSKWQGRCSECGAWGSVSEERQATEAINSRKKSIFPDNAEIIDLSAITGKDEDRVKVGIEEVDRVLGGGVVHGSLILLGGEPGIGKSTLVLQIAEALTARLINACPLSKNNKDDYIIEGEKGKEGKDGRGEKNTSLNLSLSRREISGILYASGEESAEQIKMRMDRLGTNPQDIHFLSETNVELICGAIQKYRPQLAIIDSIQMLYSNDIDSECGSVAQIRACAAKLMGVAKMSKAAEENLSVGMENVSAVENTTPTLPSKGRAEKRR